MGIEDDAALARRLAEAAGALLLEVRASGMFAGKALGAAGDRIASTFLTAALREQRPNDHLLSEEEGDDRVRCDASRVWIVDPLDGTREFAEGRDDWAVHVALAVDGHASLGAVALPARGITLASDLPVPPPGRAAPPRMLVSRTRPPAVALHVAESLSAELVAMGSAGAKAMAVVLGEGEIYLHAGGQYEWDNAAPVAVARAAGLHVSRLDGSPLVYNCENPYLPDLLICRPEFASEVLARAAQFGG